MVTRVTQLLLVALVAGGCSSPYGASDDTNADGTPSAKTNPPSGKGTTTTTTTTSDTPTAAALDYRRLANETHDFVVGNLLAPSGSYRATLGADRTDEWHDVSQIGADVAMIALGDPRYQAYVDKSFGFMDRLWDNATPVGGYFATSAADGSNVDRTTKYVDDNSLAGVTWLDSYDTISEQSRRVAYLAAARATANFLMQGGVWDDVYGGGFYWSTAKPDKPTQSNGLALQLFLRLFALTGETYYRDWADSVMGWLDGKMYDAASGLYAWKWETAGRNDAKFTYDQAILIDAHLVRFAQTKDSKDLDRARSVANAMHAVLWDKANGGYVISTEDRRLSPVFSAWASCTLVRLFEADHNQVWLDRAAENVTALGKQLRDEVNHGYVASARPDGTERSTDFQAVDQAWMQRAQAMLARH